MCLNKYSTSQDSPLMWCWSIVHVLCFCRLHFIFIDRRSRLSSTWTDHNSIVLTCRTAIKHAIVGNCEMQLQHDVSLWTANETCELTRPCVECQLFTGFSQGTSVDLFPLASRLCLNGLHSALLILASQLSSIVLPQPIEIKLRGPSPPINISFLSNPCTSSSLP